MLIMPSMLPWKLAYLNLFACIKLAFYWNYFWSAKEITWSEIFDSVVVKQAIKFFNQI